MYKPHGASPSYSRHRLITCIATNVVKRIENVRWKKNPMHLKVVSQAKCRTTVMGFVFSVWRPRRTICGIQLRYNARKYNLYNPGNVCMRFGPSKSTLWRHGALWPQGYKSCENCLKISIFRVKKQCNGKLPSVHHLLNASKSIS